MVQGGDGGCNSIGVRRGIAATGGGGGYNSMGAKRAAAAAGGEEVDRVGVSRAVSLSDE